MSAGRDPFVPMRAYPLPPTVYAVEESEPEGPGTFTATELFRWMRRRAGSLFLFAATGLVIALAAAYWQKPVYRAHVVLEIDSPNQNFLNLKSVDPSSQDYATEPFIQTQIKKLQGARVLDGVGQRMHLRDRAEFGAKGIKDPTRAADRVIKTLGDNLTVRSSGGASRLVEVQYESIDPQLAADVANAIGEELIRQMSDRRIKVNRQTAAALAGQLLDMKATLARSEKQLLEYAGSAGMYQTEASGSLAEDRLRQAQAALARAEEARLNEQAKYEQIKSSTVGALPEILDDSTLRNYQVKLTDLKKEAAQLATLVTPEHYKLKQINAQIAELESAMERERNDVLGRIKNDYESAKERERLASKAYAAQHGSVASQASGIVRYSMLKREVDTNRQVYEAILQRAREVGVASEIPTSFMQIVDPARVPTSPAKPVFMLYAAMGLLVGAFVGVANVLVRSRNDNPMEAPGDAAMRLRLPELGVIPDVINQTVTRALGSGNGNGNSIENRGPFGEWNPIGRQAETVEFGRDHRSELALISWRDKDSIVAESFRSTLASVLFSGGKNGRPHTVVFTSACPGEGKTVVSSNFGIALAETGHRVLLVDGDLRRPRVHRIFNIPNTRGLSNILLESTPLADYLPEDLAVQSQIPGLSIMPSGSATGSIPNLIYSARATKLFTHLREEFDSVLIDSPPLSLADARGLARMADGVIFVVRADRTPSDLALAALRRLAEDGTTVLGTVLNSWNPKKTSYYGYGIEDLRNYAPDGSSPPVNSIQGTIRKWGALLPRFDWHAWQPSLATLRGRVPSLQSLRAKLPAVSLPQVTLPSFDELRAKLPTVVAIRSEAPLIETTASPVVSDPLVDPSLSAWHIQSLSFETVALERDSSVESSLAPPPPAEDQVAEPPLPEWHIEPAIALEDAVAEQSLVEDQPADIPAVVIAEVPESAPPAWRTKLPSWESLRAKLPSGEPIGAFFAALWSRLPSRETVRAQFPPIEISWPALPSWQELRILLPSIDRGETGLLAKLTELFGELRPELRSLVSWRPRLPSLANLPALAETRAGLPSVDLKTKLAAIKAFRAQLPTRDDWHRAVAAPAWRRTVAATATLGLLLAAVLVPGAPRPGVVGPLASAAASPRLAPPSARAPTLTLTPAHARPSASNMAKTALPAATPPVNVGAGPVEVVHEVLPEVARNARASIHGKIKVKVRVHVDPAGSVVMAKLDSPGPSKYFANLALQAARDWKFREEKDDSARQWTLRFEFVKNETRVQPSRVTP